MSGFSPNCAFARPPGLAFLDCSIRRQSARSCVSLINVVLRALRRASGQHPSQQAFMSGFPLTSLSGHGLGRGCGMGGVTCKAAGASADSHYSLWSRLESIIFRGPGLVRQEQVVWICGLQLHLPGKKPAVKPAEKRAWSFSHRRCQL